jgi:hypothetical protein
MATAVKLLIAITPTGAGAAAVAAKDTLYRPRRGCWPCARSPLAPGQHDAQYLRVNRPPSQGGRAFVLAAYVLCMARLPPDEKPPSPSLSPTAVQMVAVAHATPSSELSALLLGVDWIVQAVPFQDSASVSSRT